jgi:hypothetical protein
MQPRRPAATSPTSAPFSRAASSGSSPDGSRQAVMVYNDFKMSISPPGGTGAPAFKRDVKKAAKIAFCGLQ